MFTGSCFLRVKPLSHGEGVPAGYQWQAIAERPWARKQEIQGIAETRHCRWPSRAAGCQSKGWSRKRAWGTTSHPCRCSASLGGLSSSVLAAPGGRVLPRFSTCGSHQSAQHHGWGSLLSAPWPLPLWLVSPMGTYYTSLGFPDSSVGKESACNAGDPGSIPGSGRSPGEGIGYPLQFLGLPLWLSW